MAWKVLPWAVNVKPSGRLENLSAIDVAGVDVQMSRCPNRRHKTGPPAALDRGFPISYCADLEVWNFSGKTKPTANLYRFAIERTRSANATSNACLAF